MTKKEQSTTSEESTAQWRSAGSLVPAEIAEEIQRISGEMPQYIGKNLKSKSTKSSDGVKDQIMTPQNQWTEIPPHSKNDDDKTVIDENFYEDKTKVRGVASKNGKTESYKVKKGDTLMKIAFEKYGNLYRWREIFEANKKNIKGFNFLVPGMTLSIEGIEYLVIEKNGSPYLIKNGDTLSKISLGIYGDSHFWRELWFNNKQLIHNPNQIFYGFTLYYRSLESINKDASRGPAEKR